MYSKIVTSIAEGKMTVSKGMKLLLHEAENWNCDGFGPHTSGEVRVLPYAGGGNMILCKSCYENEKRERQRQSADCPDWNSLKVYTGE